MGSADLRPPLPLGDDRTANERTRLTELLEFQRAAMQRKVSGLGPEALARRLPPSDLSLGGLLHHLAMIEDSWFTWDFAGAEPPEPWASADWSEAGFEFRMAEAMSPEAIRTQHEVSVARSRAVVAAADSLEQLSARTDDDGGHWNLRWILTHMIEEYARHLGHADLIRQSIDGVVGN